MYIWRNPAKRTALRTLKLQSEQELSELARLKPDRQLETEIQAKYQNIIKISPSLLCFTFYLQLWLVRAVTTVVVRARYQRNKNLNYEQARVQ